MVRAIPAAGGLSMSDLLMVIEWVCPRTAEEGNVCVVGGISGVLDFEQLVKNKIPKAVRPVQRIHLNDFFFLIFSP